MKAKYSRGGKNPRIFLLFLIFALSIFGVGQNFAQAEPEQINFEVLQPIEFSELEEIEMIDTGTLAGWYKSETPRATVSTVSYNYVPTAAPSYSSSVTIMGRTLEIIDTNTTASTPSSQVARFVRGGAYDGRFLFAHNYSWLFGGLANLYSGYTFSTNIYGTTHNYRVAYVITVPNDAALANNMNDIAKAKYNGVQYSLSLMTCAGTSYGNGNASHRTLVFAYEF